MHCVHICDSTTRLLIFQFIRSVASLCKNILFTIIPQFLKSYLSLLLWQKSLQELNQIDTELTLKVKLHLSKRNQCKATDVQNERKYASKQTNKKKNLLN